MRLGSNIHLMTAEQGPSYFDINFLRDNVSAARDVTTNAEILAARTLRELLKREDSLSVDRDSMIEAATETSQTMGVAAGRWVLNSYDKATITIHPFDSGITKIFTYFNKGETPTHEGLLMEIESLGASVRINSLSANEGEPDFVRRLRESDKLTKLQFAVELLSRATPIPQETTPQATS